MRSPVMVSVGLVGALALGTVVSTSTAGATAKVRPSVTFHLASKRITVGAEAKFSYSASHVGRRSILAFQAQEGTAHHWRTIKRLSGKTGTATFKETSVGHFIFRVAALTSHKPRRLIAASHKGALYAYGSVPFKTLCHNGHAGPQNLSGECPFGTAQVGGRIFNYVAYGEDGDDYPDYHNWFDFTTTTCRSVTVGFGITDDSGQSGDQAYVQVITATRNPQVGSTSFGTIGSFTAQLDGRPWDLNVSESLPTDDEGRAVVNGTASCYTLSGH